MNLRDAYPLFLDHGRAERNYAQETLGKHRECFNSWILPHLGDKPLEEISRLDILSFRSKMKSANLGINRQYSILMVLKVFLKFCRQVLKLHCLDPDQEIRLPQRPTPHVQYLTDGEVEQVKEAIPLHTFTGL